MTRSSNWRGCVTIVSRSVLLTVPRAWCSLQILNVNNRFLRLSIYWETEIYVVGNPVVPTKYSTKKYKLNGAPTSADPVFGTFYFPTNNPFGYYRF